MLTLDPIWTPLPQQRIYRALLRAFAYPGEVVALAGHTGAEPAWVGVLAALLDATTPLHDHARWLDERLWRMLGVRSVGLAEAAFVLADGGRAPDADFAPPTGTLLTPEHGATLILTVATLGSGPLNLVLRGPGVDGTRRLAVAGLDHAWLTRRAEWNSDFPLGVDLILADREQVAAIPRTAIIHIDEG